MGTWFLGIIRGLFAAIDKIVVWLVDSLYGLIIDISRVQIFTNDNLKAFELRITAILTIFMIFKLSFSFLTYIINPEQMTDKSKGFGKIIQNIAISLVLLVSYQFLFDKAMDLQHTLINNNTIPKLVMGSGHTDEDYMNPNIVSFPLFSAFVVPNTILLEAEGNEYCVSYSSAFGLEGIVPNPTPTGVCNGLKDYEKGYNENNGKYDNLETAINTIVKNKDTYDLFDYFLPLEKDGVFAFDYKFLISTACGVFAALVLLSFCFDVAVRSIKLSFLRLIAPIPIISYVDPNKGEGVFKKWLSTVGKTYADLFIRLLAIFFAISIIQMIAGTPYLQDFDKNNITNPFVVIFIILGALMFAKQFPKLIQDITGINLDSKLQLNPLKRIRDDAVGGKYLSKGAKALGAGLVGGGFAATGNAANRIKNFKNTVAANEAAGKSHAKLRALGGVGASTLGGALGGFSHSAKSAAKADKITKGISEGVTKANTNRTQREISKEDGATAIGIMAAKVEDKLGLETKYQRMKRKVDNMKNIDKSVDAIDSRMESEILKNKYQIGSFSKAIDLKNAYESLRNSDINQIRNESVQAYRARKTAVENQINDAKSYINKYGLNENSRFTVVEAGNLKQRLVSSGMNDAEADTIVNQVRSKYNEYSSANQRLSTDFSRSEDEVASDAVKAHSEAVRNAQSDAFKAMKDAKDEYFEKVNDGSISDAQVKTTYDTIKRTIEKSEQFDAATRSIFETGSFQDIKSKSGDIKDDAIVVENSEEYRKAQAEHTNAGVREGSYNNYKNPNATKQ